MKYVTLGRSGLSVSQFCLGAMTFGSSWGWGATEPESREMFYRFVDAGGNFVDTANVYTNGESEEILGRLLKDRGLRDRIVLATKFTFQNDPGNSPHGGGNGRKNATRSLETSLDRLGLAYIDLYWMHCWDRVTPVEEVVETFDYMVRAGKILHYGFSDVPAWYAVRAFDYATANGLARPIALQNEYSLAERAIEREHIPASQEIGLGIAVWSPLAGGFLSGKYKRGEPLPANNRMTWTGASGRMQEDRAWDIIDALSSVSDSTGHTPAEIALAWVSAQPGVTSTIIGARDMSQMEANLRALDFALSTEHMLKLDEASALPAVHPYKMFKMNKTLFGRADVSPWTASKTR